MILSTASMPTCELDVLKPIDPSISDSDDWPIYDVTNAQVYHASTSKLANLLHAFPDNPLRLEGRLEPPGRQYTKNRKAIHTSKDQAEYLIANLSQY